VETFGKRRKNFALNAYVERQGESVEK